MNYNKINNQTKKYNIVLHSNLSAEMTETAVRRYLNYDEYQILTQEDWDNACQKWILEQLIPKSTYPISSLDFEEIKEEQKEDNNGNT